MLTFRREGATSVSRYGEGGKWRNLPQGIPCSNTCHDKMHSVWDNENATCKIRKKDKECQGLTF